MSNKDKGIKARPEDIAWAKTFFAGRLCNDRSLPRLDRRAVDPRTGEVLGKSNDLEALGKAGTINEDADRPTKSARCGMHDLPAQPAAGFPEMTLVITPTPDGQLSRSAVFKYADRNWVEMGLVPRPGGPNGTVRMEPVKSRYDKWAEGSEPKWKDPENRKGFLNAAAMNAWRREQGWMPVIYTPWGNKAVLAAYERAHKRGKHYIARYCVPCDPATGEPYEWVWETIAKGRRIELTSWDEAFQPWDLETA